MAIEVILNYSADPPFTKAIRDYVDELFKKCFDDAVKFTWNAGVDEKKKLGKNLRHLLVKNPT